MSFSNDQVMVYVYLCYLTKCLVNLENSEYTPHEFSFIGVCIDGVMEMIKDEQQVVSDFLQSHEWTSEQQLMMFNMSHFRVFSYDDFDDFRKRFPQFRVTHMINSIPVAFRHAGIFDQYQTLIGGYTLQV